ncbi:MAG: indolepyruvate oxidoreductase subunit beta [Elusimicrobia bacterium]|nr:indolepyruvate oxidoreductase subunit beta [Elusimicrobiota bacterium]
MKKTYSILLNGVGGQGIILASDIICLAAMYDGFDAKKSEIHGMSQRGGSVFSHIRFGEKVYSPVIAKRSADIIVSLEEVEILRWIDYASPEVKMIVLKNRIQPVNSESYPETIEAFIKSKFKNSLFIVPEELAEGINRKCINTAVLGIVSKYLDLSEKSWMDALADSVPKRTVEINQEAFEKGRKYEESGA